MRYRVYQKKLLSLWKQRNGYLLLAMGAVGVNLLLSGFLFLALGRERVVLMPPSLTQSVWLTRHQVSSSYLSQLSQFIVSLRLNVTPTTVQSQYQQLLVYVAPQYQADLRSLWQQEAKAIEEQQLTQVFYPSEVAVLPAQLTVSIKGSTKRYLNEMQVSDKKMHYTLHYQIQHGQPVLISFKEELTDEG